MNLVYRKININELPAILPDFESSYEPKDFIIKKWMIDWILSSIKLKRIKENDILPSKSEISKYLKVSVGTVQNAIKYIEDEGFLKSKQRIGTMIANTCKTENTPKLTSKRDKAVIVIKKIIITNEYKIGKPIPSTRSMSEQTGISINTMRLAYEYLCTIGILESLQMRGNDSNWYLKKIPKLTSKELKQTNIHESDTIVDKLTEILKEYFAAKFKTGDKLPSHENLAKHFNVSLKTINDCIHRLNIQGIVLTKRGSYGSIFVRNPKLPNADFVNEHSIFVRDNKQEFYNYEKIEIKITEYINKNYTVGDKLPTISKFAELYEVSTNTIRKALSTLEEKGCIAFSRGRFGGTYLIKEIENTQPYQWVSINPKYI